MAKAEECVPYGQKFPDGSVGVYASEIITGKDVIEANRTNPDLVQQFRKLGHLQNPYSWLIFAVNFIEQDKLAQALSHLEYANAAYLEANLCEHAIFNEFIIAFRTEIIRRLDTTIGEKFRAEVLAIQKQTKHNSMTRYDEYLCALKLFEQSYNDEKYKSKIKDCRNGGQ